MVTATETQAARRAIQCNSMATDIQPSQQSE